MAECLAIFLQKKGLKTSRVDFSVKRIEYNNKRQLLDNRKAVQLTVFDDDDHELVDDHGVDDHELVDDHEVDDEDRGVAFSKLENLRCLGYFAILAAR